MQDTCSESFLRQLYMASKAVRRNPCAGGTPSAEAILAPYSFIPLFPPAQSYPCLLMPRSYILYSCRPSIWQLIRPRAVIVTRRITTKRSRDFSDVSSQGSSCSDRFFFRRRWTNDKASFS